MYYRYKEDDELEDEDEEGIKVEDEEDEDGDRAAVAPPVIIKRPEDARLQRLAVKVESDDEGEDYRNVTRARVGTLALFQFSAQRFFLTFTKPWKSYTVLAVLQSSARRLLSYLNIKWGKPQENNCQLACLQFMLQGYFRPAFLRADTFPNYRFWKPTCDRLFGAG